MKDAEVCAFITKVLCAHRGRLTVPQLLREVKLPEGQLREVIQAAGPERFVLLDTVDPSGVTQNVVATARVRVCRRKTCHRPCGNLHLCKLNLLHRCHYSERNLCKYSHEIFSSDNLNVLDEHELWGLNEEELAVLLIQNDPFFLPEICKSYKGENRKQTCMQQPLCERLHICEHFTRGDCGFPNCLRSHNLMDRKVLVVMKEHGLSPDLVQNIQDICNSKHSHRKKSGWKGAHRKAGPNAGKGRNREEPFRGSREFLSTNLLFPSESHSLSPEPPGSPLDEVSDLASNFQHLGNQKVSPPPSVFSKLASVGGPGLAERSQQLLENEDLCCGVSEDSGSCGLSDEDLQRKSPVPWQKEDSFLPTFSSVPSAPIPRPRTFQKDEVRSPSKTGLWKNDAPLAPDLPSPRPSSDRVTAISERNKASPRNLVPRPSQKNEDGDLLELKMNGMSLDEPLPMGLPATRPLHDKAAVVKIKSWDADHRSLASTRPRISDRTAEHEGFTAEDDRRFDETDKICLDHLSQGCALPWSCKQVHFHLPYQWQVREGNTWKELQPLETIEKEYCDPQNSIFTIGNRTINFSKMTCNSDPIRRISTCSSVKAKDMLFTTKWIWYWRDDEGMWIEYGKQVGQHQQVASIDSSYLETIYCNSSNAIVVPFQAGTKNYELNFQGMIQTNVNSRTQKKVCRRPTFVSAWDMQQIKHERNPSPSEPLTATSLPQANRPCQNDYQLVELSSQDPEYDKVSKCFRESMKNFKIDKIKKIYNAKLKNAFYRKKMEKPGSLEETLFCAVLRSRLASICANNFKITFPILSRSNLEMGNYFTKEAIRSHKDRVKDPKLCVMIVAQVLVGNYTEESQLLRAPPLGFDSFVDTMQNPSVFVVFDKEQIYPRYVIEYSEAEKNCFIS